MGVGSPSIQSLQDKDIVGIQAAPPLRGGWIVDCVAATDVPSTQVPTGVGAASVQSTEQVVEDAVVGQTDPYKGATDVVLVTAMSPSAPHVPAVTYEPMIQSLHSKNGVGVQAAPSLRGGWIVDCVAATVVPSTHVPIGVGAASVQSTEQVVEDAVVGQADPYKGATDVVLVTAMSPSAPHVPAVTYGPMVQSLQVDAVEVGGQAVPPLEAEVKIVLVKVAKPDVHPPVCENESTTQLVGVGGGAGQSEVEIVIVAT